MTSGIPGSTWRPHADTAIRLARWRRYATDGMPVDHIAAELECTHCREDEPDIDGYVDRADWPCSTIQATANALGLTEGNDRAR